MNHRRTTALCALLILVIALFSLKLKASMAVSTATSIVESTETTVPASATPEITDFVVIVDTGGTQGWYGEHDEIAVCPAGTHLYKTIHLEFAGYQSATMTFLANGDLKLTNYGHDKIFTRYEGLRLSSLRMKDNIQKVTYWYPCSGENGLIGVTFTREDIPDKKYAEDTIVGAFIEIAHPRPSPSEISEACQGATLYEGVSITFRDRALSFGLDAGDEIIYASIFNPVSGGLDPENPVTLLDISESAGEISEVRYHEPEGEITSIKVIRCGDKFRYVE